MTDDSKKNDAASEQTATGATGETGAAPSTEATAAAGATGATGDAGKAQDSNTPTAGTAPTAAAGGDTVTITLKGEVTGTLTGKPSDALGSALTRSGNTASTLVLRSEDGRELKASHKLSEVGSVVTVTRKAKSS